METERETEDILSNLEEYGLSKGPKSSADHNPFAWFTLEGKRVNVSIEISLKIPEIPASSKKTECFPF